MGYYKDSKGKVDWIGSSTTAVKWISKKLAKWLFMILKMLLYFGEPIGLILLFMAFALNFGIIDHYTKQNQQDNNYHIQTQIDRIERQVTKISEVMESQIHKENEQISKDNTYNLEYKQPTRMTVKTSVNSNAISVLLAKAKEYYGLMYLFGTIFVVMGKGFDRWTKFKDTSEIRLYDKKKEVPHKPLAVLGFVALVTFLSMVICIVLYIYNSSISYASETLSGKFSSAAMILLCIYAFSAIWLWVEKKRRKLEDADVL